MNFFKMLLPVAVLSLLTGCAGGYVATGGEYAGNKVVDPLFGARIHENAGDARAFSNRGAASRTTGNSHPDEKPAAREKT